MADVTLNLLYNDNGASTSINNLIRELQRIEQKQWKINLSGIGQSFASELEGIVNKYQGALTTITKSFGSRSSREMDAGLSLLEKSLSRVNGQIEKTKLQMVDMLTTPSSKGQKVGAFDELEKQLSRLEVQAGRIQGLIDDINSSPAGQRIQSISGLLTDNGVDKISEDLAINIGRTFGEIPEKYRDEWQSVNDIARKEIADNIELEKISAEERKKILEQEAEEKRKALEKFQEEERKALERQKEEERKAAEAALEEYNKKMAERKQAIDNANVEITLGNKKVWEGIRDVANGSINSIIATYNTFKAVVTAPLNLTGVSSFVSMLESMEGSLLLNKISSNITGGFSEGVERFDILQTFPTVMAAIGFSSEKSKASMDKLYQSVLGLPTAFEDIVHTTQYFALVLDDLDKATDLAIAANNAFVASGATSQQITAGMRQLQYIIDGTKLRSTQWYSLIRSMPVALREVGDALGYPDFSSFTADLMGNKIAADTLIDSLIDVGLNSEKISGVIDVMKTRVQAALDNVRNAAKRMGNTMFETLDATLRRTGGKGIAENIKGVSGILDHIASVASAWISQHGDEIQNLIDKFMSIDWASVIPGFFEGLIKFANNALDNIGNYIVDIGDILQKARQLFNDIESSRFIQILGGLKSIIPSLAEIFVGISTISFGASLRASGISTLLRNGTNPYLTGGSSLLGGTLAGKLGGALSSVGGIAGAGAIAGAIALGITNIIDLAYQLIDKGWKEGSAEYISHWKWMTPLGPAYDALKDFMVSESSGNGNFMESPLRTIIEWMTGLKNNGALSEYRLRSLSSSKVGDIASRYSAYPFANKDTIAMLEALQTALTIGGGDSGLLNKDISRITSSMNLADEIAKPYDAAIDALEEKKKEVIKEIDKINEEIAKKFSGADVNIFTFYKKLYDNSKKYFSEQFEEANGWGYSNTTRDRAEFLEKNLPKITGLIDDITQYALDNYSDDEGVLAVVAQFMADFDWNDPEQLAVLVKNYGGKSMQEVFEQYFEQQAKNLNLDEAIQKALLNSQLKFKENELEAIDIEQKHLEEERESALAPVIDMIEDDMEILEGDFDSVVESTKQAGKRIVDALEGLFNSLSSAKPKSSLNSFFQGIYNTIMSWRNRILPILPTSNSFKVSPYNDNLLGQGYYSATGGFMFAPRGTDTIPAMLTPGEYVQRRAAVEHFGRVFMDRINALDLRGALRSLQIATPYSTGGFIKNETRNYRDNHAVVNQTFNNSSMNYGMRRANRFVRALG